jgi:osmotically-inducible protein OsmY
LTIHTSIPAFALIAALAGTCLGQQAAKPAPTTKKAVATSHPAPAHAVQTDAQLEKAIRARFGDSKISEDKFEVHVQGGRATLTGNTNVLQHKGTATRLAHAAGATDVVNNIEPSDEAREKAVANLTKGRRRAQVKRTETVARSESR